ncbi:Phosphoglycerate mutase [Gluconacetobacter diazotrophicus PA1 5]|uniref:Histidine phosphatase family protein n=2 Tax=Gluconacetobacter diazotrophicus TaxID=33996 RepID=A0A7W4FEE1_GLUDI|nr:histidine phosphatase family protein [Gluconacetobacter diazotrophicus]ACI50871.1 Phosphoglycerate mutase [Gluconacetobacter diazotrophicus PA1 5]MBB2156193.1 histidine phosphatase family protein [Gluconacetobacter diazotrophicus]TWB08675.1 putative phosphoglycerate mutase [Gluconacetobacter diazotrophicus]CAP54877.1 Probable phosphoglycerate mutase gpmB [Gluconacetobacter diazotrophicus PA1 5]
MTKLIARPYWYLRHGETDWNAEGLSQGRSDIPLNARGIAQAEAAGALLSQDEGRYVPVARIVSSPLVRALRTAQIVSAAMAGPGGTPLPIATDDGLQEVCFGEQEGQPMGNWYDAWIAGEYTPKGAEPFVELRARAVAAVNRALDGEGTVLIVCHGAMFRALRSAMDLPPNVRLPNAEPLWVTPPSGADAAAWSLATLD